MRKHILFIFSSLLMLFVVLAFGLKEEKINEQESILNVQNIGVDIDNPARFYFYREKGFFKRGDVLSISCKEISMSSIQDKLMRKFFGKGKYEDLKMVLINLNSGTEFVIPSSKFAESFTFGTKQLREGNYSIEFTGTKKPIPLNIKLNRTLNREKTEEEKYASHDLLHVEAMYIGEGPEGQPKFNLGLKQGDQITITSSSKRTIKFKVTQTGKTHPVPAGPLAMAEDGSKKLHFFLEESKDKEGFFIFKKGDRRFIDLIIRKTPAPKKESGSAAGGDSGGNGAGDSLGGANPEDESKYEGLSPAEKMAMQQMEFNKSLLARMDSMNKKSFVTKPVYVSGFTEEPPYSVPGKMDLAASNRSCTQLRLQKSAYWTFWLGVGDQAEELYKNRETKALERGKYQSLLENYAAFVLANPNAKIDMPIYQALNSDLRRIGEYVEYAIVNGNNKNQFENGDPYTPFKSTWQGRTTISDYGSSSYPDEKLFLCLCNHNKISPVNVYFKYEMYDRITEEK